MTGLISTVLQPGDYTMTIKKFNISCITVCMVTAFMTANLFAAAPASSESELSAAPSAASSGKSPNVIFVEKLQDALSSNDIQSAIALFENLPASLESDTDLKLLHASILLSAGDYAKAKTLNNELLAANSDNIEALELAAQIAIASKNKTDEKTALNALLAKNPNNPTANIIKGNQQALRKKYKLAKNFYLKALTGDSTNLEAIFGYAQMSYYTDNLDEAKRYFQRLLELDPYNAQAYAYMGKLAAENENYYEAISQINKALELHPNNYDYYIDLGQYKRYTGKFKEAEVAWSKAISIDPSYFLAYTYRAGLYDEQNMFKEALADYHKIIETNPKYYYSWEEIGILEFHLGNWAGARNAFLKANSIFNSTAYQLMVILTYLKENNLFKAKEYAQLAMKPLDRNSLDYKIIRLFHDQGGVNAENAIMKDLDKETDKNKRGKMMYYFAMYFDLKGMNQIAREYFVKIQKMQSPMFFEYRLAEWGMEQ